MCITYYGITGGFIFIEGAMTGGTLYLLTIPLQGTVVPTGNEGAIPEIFSGFLATEGFFKTAGNLKEVRVAASSDISFAAFNFPQEGVSFSQSFKATEYINTPVVTPAVA